VDVVLDEFVASLQELRGQDNNRGSSITNLSILNLRKFDEHFCRGMSDLQLFQNCGAIICDSDISNVVNEHLIETLGTKRSFNDVAQSKNGHDVLGAYILTLFSLTKNGNL
jgi:hypothetical protein